MCAGEAPERWEECSRFEIEGEQRFLFSVLEIEGFIEIKGFRDQGFKRDQGWARIFCHWLLILGLRTWLKLVKTYLILRWEVERGWEGQWDDHNNNNNKWLPRKSLTTHKHLCNRGSSLTSYMVNQVTHKKYNKKRDGPKFTSWYGNLCPSEVRRSLLHGNNSVHR